MPAPATSSRHLYTGHRRGHIQAAPRLRTHRSEPLSQDHPQIPVSMPSLFRFDASAVVHTCSSSHRTPAPLQRDVTRQRSPPRLLTDAACGGLESPPARRPRRTYLHHWHSTDRADDLLHHHHHFPSGHTWVPIIRSWPLTRGYALHTGTRNRYEFRYTRTQHRPPSRQVNDHGRVSENQAAHTPATSCAADQVPVRQQRTESASFVRHGICDVYVSATRPACSNSTACTSRRPTPAPARLATPTVGIAARQRRAPPPTTGAACSRSARALAESEPRVRQWFESNAWRYEDGCVGWAGFQQNLSAVFNAPACSAAVGLGILYVEAAFGNEALVDLGYFSKC